MRNSCDFSLVLVEVQQPSVVPPRRVFSSALKLDEEARRRSEMATKQLMQNYHGPPNVGIKLMSKMGYGVAGEHCAALHPCIFFWLLRGFHQAAPGVRAVASHVLRFSTSQWQICTGSCTCCSVPATLKCDTKMTTQAGVLSLDSPAWLIIVRSLQADQPHQTRFTRGEYNAVPCFQTPRQQAKKQSIITYKRSWWISSAFSLHNMRLLIETCHMQAQGWGQKARALLLLCSLSHWMAIQG